MKKLVSQLKIKRIMIIALLIAVVQIGTVGALMLQTAPVIDVWYGNTQSFGAIGTPQEWVNIVGNVSDPDGIDLASLHYVLNGNTAVSYNIGPNQQRLGEAGAVRADAVTPGR